MCTGGPQSSVRQVEGGSALRDDSWPCLTLADSGAASVADCDERCEQRDFFIGPPDEKFNFKSAGWVARRAELIRVGLTVQRDSPIPLSPSPRASNVILECRRQAVMRCRKSRAARF
jgi:hypothetical protein